MSNHHLPISLEIVEDQEIMVNDKEIYLVVKDQIIVLPCFLLTKYNRYKCANLFN